jgi:hypothetical protein
MPLRFAYRNSVKRRWEGRQLLEIFVTEFRDRTREYYVSQSHACLLLLLSAPPD